MENSKKMWIGIGLAVLVVLLGVWFFMQSPTNNQPTVNEPTTNNEPSESAQDISSVDAGTAAAAPISYASALVKYADRRIQLDKMCQARPNNVTYKDN